MSVNSNAGAMKSTDFRVDGNIGVIQTMVGELVKKPEHERKPLLH